MMIAATPNSELKKMIQKRLKDLGLMETVRIIEKPGQKFIDILKNNIKKKKKAICPEENCLIGKNPKGGNCRTNEIVYEITCKQCDNVYIGESSRNGHTRSIEHMEQMLRNDESSVLMRHRREKHNDMI